MILSADLTSIAVILIESAAQGVHPKDAGNLPIAQLVSGFLGALVGAGVSVGSVFYSQRRSRSALRRWIGHGHFDLFQDVADCANEYDNKNHFGVFRERLSQQVRQLRDVLERDLTGSLNEEEFANTYRSLSSVDYLIFAHDREFGREYMVDYIDCCMADMRSAQDRFGPWPEPRPNSELALMKGERKVTMSSPSERP